MCFGGEQKLLPAPPGSHINPVEGAASTKFGHDPEIPSAFLDRFFLLQMLFVKMLSMSQRCATA
jgi:hypothetical protein